MVCNDVEVEPVLQEITGEVLTRGINKAPDVRLDIHARGSGRGKNLHSLTFGCATQMQILIKTSAQGGGANFANFRDLMIHRKMTSHPVGESSSSSLSELQDGRSGVYGFFFLVTTTDTQLLILNTRDVTKLLDHLF